jgi:hypothetical protein
LSQGEQLGQAEGVILVGLAFELLELPGLGSGVGNVADEAEFVAQIMDPAGQPARLDDDGGGAVLGEKLLEVFAVGGQAGEGGGGRVAGVDTGNGLVFAQVDGQNNTGVGFR